MAIKRVVKITYDPMPKQALFHGLSAKYRGFCGGWGNGKTSAGCVETMTTLLEYPGTNCIIARKTRPELRSTTWDMWVNGDTSQEHGWHGVPRELILNYNKSELYMEIRTADPNRPSKVWGLPLDDPKKIENYNLGFYWIDQAEEVEEDIFLKFQGRLRQKSSPREGILTFNPNGHNWLWKRFIDPNRRDDWKRLYRCVEATTYDNPNLPQDYLDQFIGLPDHWLQRFVYGSHEVFVGQIFSDWNPELHVIQPFRIPSNWQRWLSIDPGIRHEGALSWVARDFQGNSYYYREHLEANQPVSWWATKMFAMEAVNDYGGLQETIFRRLIGREAGQRSQTDGKTVVQVFNEHGVYPEYADRDPVARISRITSALRVDPEHRHPITGRQGAPKLYVFSDCDKLQEYIPQYRWVPQRTNFTEEEAPERPRKKDDHNIDNLGHVLLAYDYAPSIEDNPGAMDPKAREAKELDDHFLREVERAAERSPVLAGLQSVA